MVDYSKYDNLLSFAPSEVMHYGPTKLLLDQYLWHAPKLGIVASYSPKKRDVADHFDVFRGVDQIESFAQASLSCATFLECAKMQSNPQQFRERFVSLFISVGHVQFHSYLVEGETFICLGQIKFYKFRQMVMDGRIYKVPEKLDLKAYFAEFSDEDLKTYNVGPDFTMVAELVDVTGRALLKDKLKENI